MPLETLKAILWPYLIKFGAFLILFSIGLGVYLHFVRRTTEFVLGKIAGLRGKSSAVFRARQSPLTEPEQELFRRMVDAMPEHVVLAQVAFSQLLYTTGPSDRENFRTMATAKQKVADFVVCGPRFGVVCIVELDDSSHDPKKDAARDAITAQAGLKTVRWHVSALPGRDEIRWKVLGLKADGGNLESSRWAPR